MPLSEVYDGAKSREFSSMSEILPPQLSLTTSQPPPPPPPSSPALTPAMRASPSSLRSLLGKAPLREKSQSTGQLSPSLSSTTRSARFSPHNLGTATTLPLGGVPFTPCLHTTNQATSSSAAKFAVENIMQEERLRRTCMEKSEADMDADMLRSVLREERIRMSRFAAELARLKSLAATSQLESEVVEEGRINSLMRRVEGLQLEKGQIVLEIEREEEKLTNGLERKLAKIRGEKALLEQQIDREQSNRPAAACSTKDQNAKDESLEQLWKPLTNGDDVCVEECEDEGEVDDSILPDLAAEAAAEHYK